MQGTYSTTKNHGILVSPQRNAVCYTISQTWQLLICLQVPHQSAKSDRALVPTPIIINQLKGEVTNCESPFLVTKWWNWLRDGSVLCVYINAYIYKFANI